VRRHSLSTLREIVRHINYPFEEVPDTNARRVGQPEMKEKIHKNWNAVRHPDKFTLSASLIGRVYIHHVNPWVPPTWLCSVIQFFSLLSFSPFSMGGRQKDTVGYTPDHAL
jgi:hypothetical protein